MTETNSFGFTDEDWMFVLAVCEEQGITFEQFAHDAILDEALAVDGKKKVR